MVDNHAGGPEGDAEDDGLPDDERYIRALKPEHAAA
jgi:hypothetical protein